MSEKQKCPYLTTKIPYTRTKADIEELLKKYHAKAVRWTEHFDQTQAPTLEFLMDVELKGVKRTLGFKMQPVILTQRKRINTRYGRTMGETPNLDASLRLLWWYIKSKLEAVSYGLVSFEKEFLSQVMMSLPSGSVVTIGEVAAEQIAKPSTDFILPSFEIKPQKQLEEKHEEDTAVKEVE